MVVIAITNGYLTLANCKARLGMTTTASDATLEAIITATSRAIDQYTGRRFYAATETRTYTARHYGYLIVDDVLSVTALTCDTDANATYDVTWPATDYTLEPVNALLDGKPYWKIKIVPYPLGTLNGFPGYPNAVRVTGSFGYSATTPALIEQMCLVQVALELRQPDDMLGVSGNPIPSEVRGASLHPWVRRSLDDFKLARIG